MQAFTDQSPYSTQPTRLFLCQLAWTASFRSFLCCLLGWCFKRPVFCSLFPHPVLGPPWILAWVSLTFDFTVCFQADTNAKLNIVFISTREMKIIQTLFTFTVVVLKLCKAVFPVCRWELSSWWGEYLNSHCSDNSLDRNYSQFCICQIVPPCTLMRSA